ncbi:MAG: hypothetical protein IT292_05580 [Deltaproteobacteria bacterium]|nr:hypothetical protein [Deltaproteobacteria bacterium]
MAATIVVPDVIRELNKRSFKAGKILCENWDVPLKDYLNSCVGLKNAAPGDAFSRKVIAETTMENNLSAGLTPDDKLFVYNDLLLSPLIQLGCHIHCLYDQAFFFNCLLHQMAARNAHMRVLLGQLCATIKLLVCRSRLTGPAYLHLKDDIFKLFDISKNIEAKTNTVLASSVKMIIEPLGLITPRYANIRRPELIEPFCGETFTGAEDAFTKVNIRIWEQLNIVARKPLLYFPESFTGEILKRHIQRGEGQIFSLLFCPDVWKIFLSLREVISTSLYQELSIATDFFWYAHMGHFLPIKLGQKGKTPVMLLIQKGETVLCEMKPDNVLQLMEEGKLFPDLILSYLVLCVLPNSVALGGPSQCEHIQAIQEILWETHRVTGFLSPGVNQQSFCSLSSRLVTHLLIEDNPKYYSVISSLSGRTVVEELEQEIERKTIGQLVGSGNQFEFLLSNAKKKGF